MSKDEIVKKQIADLNLIKIECLRLQEKLDDTIAYIEMSLKSKVLSRAWEYNPEELLGQNMRIGLAIRDCAEYYYENKEND